MFVLTSNPGSGVHLFSTESFAVEALVLGGKEFVNFLSKIVWPYKNSPIETEVFKNELKEILEKLDKIQTIFEFNNLLSSFKKTSVCKISLRYFQDYYFKTIERKNFVSVFFLPYEDEEVYNIYNRTLIAVPFWELKEVVEDNLLSDSFEVLKKEMF